MESEKLRWVDRWEWLEPKKIAKAALRVGTVILVEGLLRSCG
ncbi:hypothetical protein ABZ897_42820 [Nonomuraea sp. NPDC046802]